MNTSDYLLAEGRADDVAIATATTSTTYRDLRRAVDTLTRRLVRLDLAPGSRVAVVSGNSRFWVAAYLAVMRAGLVAVPLATALDPATAARNAAWVDCGTAFVERRLERRFASVVPPGGTVLTDDLLAADDAAPTGTDDPPGAETDQPVASALVDPDDDAVLLFTSGTTARPKVVRVTHRNIQANTDSIVTYLGVARDDRMLVVLPFFYCFGASLLHTHLRVGARLVLCPTLTFPETAIEMMREHACTGVAGVPSTFQLLLRASSFASRPVESLRHIQQAGGKLAPVLIEEVVSAQPQARMFVMYGATEATARLSYLPPELVLERLGSIGRGIPGVRLRVVDGSGREVAPGEVGEIRAAGANITRGYWRDADATALKYAGGELHTGDLATVDADGFIYVVDRQEDFIKSWGHRVSSQEVEAGAMRLPGLVAAAAVGAPDEAAGEAIVLFCVVRPGGGTTAEDVLDHCRRSMPRHMVPREVRLLDRLPLNVNGKVAKARLRELLAREPVAP